MLAYPQDRAGWGHLCRMLTQANMRGEKGAPDLRCDDLFEWGDLLSLAVLPELAGPAEEDVALLRQAASSVSGTRCRLAVAPTFGGNDRFRIEQAAAMAAMAGLPLMATNDVLYHTPGQRPLQDVLTAIRLNVPVAQAGFELEANAERHLKAPAEMARLFRRHPGGARRDAALCRKPAFLAWVSSNTTIPTSRRNRASNPRRNSRG